MIWLSVLLLPLLSYACVFSKESPEAAKKGDKSRDPQPRTYREQCTVRYGKSWISPSESVGYLGWGTDEQIAMLDFSNCSQETLDAIERHCPEPGKITLRRKIEEMEQARIRKHRSNLFKAKHSSDSGPKSISQINGPKFHMIPRSRSPQALRAFPPMHGEEADIDFDEYLDSSIMTP